MNKYLKFLTLSGVMFFSAQSFVNAADIDEKEKGASTAMTSVSRTDARRFALPTIIQEYVDASNRHDARSIVACFSENGVVYDEEREHRGKEAIAEWVAETTEKYKFQFNPVSFKDSGLDKIVSIEVSGTFPGSPITLSYHFLCEREKLVSLKIE